MKILIVTAWYHPFIHPRAHRWTAIAEHWAGEGHEIHVLTARVRESGRSEVLNGVQIHRAGFDSLKEWVYFWFGSRKARGRVGVKPAKPSPAVRLFAWIYRTVWKNIFFPDDACVWYFPARRKLRQLLEKEAFDAVITVSLPFTGHLLGLEITSRTFRKFQTFGKLKPVWLADIGDPFSFQANPPNNRFFYQKKNRRLERLILETADAVTVTTEATLRKYREQFGEQAVAKMAVIHPLLLLKQTVEGTLHQAIHHSSLKIGYFGALYAPTRTPDAFLDLLAQTFALRPDLRGRLEIHFYGEIFPEFFGKLSTEPSIQLHGLCSREEAWVAMQQMDILLNIGNTTDFQLPSKAVEYLAAGKPVLNLSYVENDPFAIFFGSTDFSPYRNAPFMAKQDAYRGVNAPSPDGLKSVLPTHPLIFNLKIENGKAQKGELQRGIEWLESEKPTLSASEIAERIAPFLVENIARQYLALIGLQLQEVGDFYHKCSCEAQMLVELQICHTKH